jgi:hypothetical protein
VVLVCSNGRILKRFCIVRYSDGSEVRNESLNNPFEIDFDALQMRQKNNRIASIEFGMDGTVVGTVLFD